LLQIHSGNAKIGILDLSLIKLLQNEQGCNFFASQCSIRCKLLLATAAVYSRSLPSLLRSQKLAYKREYLDWTDLTA